MNRFWQEAPRSPDRDIMERASGLRVDIYRDRDGDLHGDVEIRCAFGAFGDNEAADALRFIRRLLSDFEKKPDDGMAAAG